MSTTDDDDDSSKDIPDDIADAFDGGNTGWDQPETLAFDDSDSEIVCRPIDHKPVGKVLYCDTYDCLAFYSLRHDKKHFYRVGKAYALADDILFDLDEQGVEKVFIGQRFERSVLEFDIEQYLEYEDGEKMHHPNFEPQRYTPKANAVRVWPNAVDTVPQ